MCIRMTDEVFNDNKLFVNLGTRYISFAYQTLG